MPTPFAKKSIAMNTAAKKGRILDASTFLARNSDVVPGAAAISQLSARPLLTPNQVQFPKHQGSVPSQALQLCVPPPVLANGQQPFAVPSHIPLVQPPFPANRPIPVPGSNALFNTKFP
ncbi:hypothetical protein CK203_078329 [Vitis vinifera]|uniref:Uncharacterized protein n=2 Tax=Vitis vinifera TaxID=29760 RepID=A0A438DXL7_VITVI|nr:hypothetical protein CK203_078329 [Vitis vinifera]